MGASLSVNRKSLFRDCGFWNVKTREQAKSFYCKCCYNVSDGNGKEKKVSGLTSCDSLTAYLQKCASVGKKKMKSKIEPAPSKKAKDVEEKEKSEDPRLESVTREIIPTKTKTEETENSSITQNKPIVSPKPQQRPTSSSSFTLSSDALRCIGNFVKSHCKNLSRLRASEVVLWLRGVDRALLIQGWQDQAFLTPPNLVFLFMLLKESLRDKFTSITQLRAEVLTCLYMAYTYSGPEISYPLKPFLVDGDREAFWDRCMDIINNLSDKMLKTNRDPKYFGELLVDLKRYNSAVDRRDG